MLSSNEINILGQVFNHSFGYSSETMKVTSSIHGDSLVLKYVAVIQFASEASMEQQKAQYEKEANDCIADALKKMKAEFREKAERSIKVTEESRDDSVELISVSAHTPRKLAYYRMNVHLKVE
ncbi:MAG: hypothetical protein CMB77_04280 [Euryarchaeota archaeon]|nr:hypothetical protein [Euryarchaeota archaeon]|tara:strand:+ start:25807 stop:26175 length:369 start_codon:yes stop_codon:yes gene_type:complete